MTREVIYYVFYYVIAHYTQATNYIIETWRLYETGHNLSQYGNWLLLLVVILMYNKNSTWPRTEPWEPLLI